MIAIKYARLSKGLAELLKFIFQNDSFRDEKRTLCINENIRDSTGRLIRQFLSGSFLVLIFIFLL